MNESLSPESLSPDLVTELVVAMTESWLLGSSSASAGRRGGGLAVAGEKVPEHAGRQRSWKAPPVNIMTTEAFEFGLFTVKRVIATDPIMYLRPGRLINYHTH